MAKVYINGIPVSATTNYASAISCTDKSGNPSNVQIELDKKGNGGGDGVDIIEITQADFNKLTEAQKKSGIYLITDATWSSDDVAKITQAEYDALSEEQQKTGMYLITDGDELSAKNMAYDGSVTGLGNNVQDAIDGLNDNVSEQNKNLNFNIEHRVLILSKVANNGKKYEIYFSTSNGITMYEDGISMWYITPTLTPSS